MLANYYKIILINIIYKTNKYKLLLLIISVIVESSWILFS